ncbi:MAG: hypothetical protein M0D55_05130 [Elusimicrobiota bacterium]|nr:MAG: hypothetical protein M0D55_05130 [Elusimicrobiota bacterium]
MKIEQFSSPTMVTWQLTRDCDLACLHCCTDSAPGKALPGELTREQALKLSREIVAAGVPYAMIVGGSRPWRLTSPRCARPSRTAASCSRSRRTGTISIRPS